MKYQKIYTVIRNHPEISVNDRSYWKSGQKGYIANNNPLYIILETPKAGLRIWVMHQWKRFNICTADMTFDIDSREYHKSFTNFYFRNQEEMAKKLEQLLSQEKGKINEAA